MPQSPKYLIVGSPEPASGKSAILLGLARQLRERHLDVAYGKPVGTYADGLGSTDEDVRLMTEALNLSDGHRRPTLMFVNETAVARRLRGEDTKDYGTELEEYANGGEGDIALLEGPSSLEEGHLFGLSVAHLADRLNAPVLLVSRYHPTLLVDRLLTDRQRLGDRLLGAVINSVPPEDLDSARETLVPFLEAAGIPVFGMLPRNGLLYSVSVGELVRQLGAQVLARGDRLNLMVEDLKIGAMNVNSALKYFRKGHNMAVVTGGDRKDIQLAALETSTHCLILTGQMPPDRDLLDRAEDLEVPVLSVDLDTLTTVEIVNRTFGRVRLHEPVKIECADQWVKEHFNVDRLLEQLGMAPAAV